jgi:hypothetical protein
LTQDSKAQTLLRLLLREGDAVDFGFYGLPGFFSGLFFTEMISCKDSFLKPCLQDKIMDV